MQRSTIALALSALALVLTTGSGVADAARLAKNTVGSKQIKNAAVKAADLKDGAVTGPKVLDGSLTGVDIDDATLANALVAAGPESQSATLTAASATVASVTFNAPSAGFAVGLGSAEFNAHATGTVIEAQLKEGGTSIASIRDWDPGDVDSLFDQAQSATFVVPVAPGVHTYDLTLDESTPGAFSEYAAARLVVLFVARGSIS
jgi:hypothetical protein